MTLSIGPQIQNAISIAFKAMQPVMLRGGTGVGKSEIIEQVCKDLGIEYIMRDLSIMEPSDLVGIPRVEDKRTHFSPPSFLPSGGKGIMMFEELNRAPAYMLAPMLELLTARRLNDYRVPDGWLMVAAVNPDDNDAYNGTRQMDAALLARFMVLNVKASVPNWVAWAKTQNIDPRVIDFVKSTPKIFDTIRSNPRAWTKVSKILKEGEQANWNNELAMNCIGGLVGEMMAKSFMSYIQNKSSVKISASDIVNNYTKFKTKICVLANGNNTEQLNSLVHEVLLFIQDPKNSCDDRKHKKNIESFIDDLPSEFRRMMRENLDLENADAA